MVEADDDDNTKADPKPPSKNPRHALATTAPMKASVRPLFTVLLLSFAAAAVLTSRFSGLRSDPRLPDPDLPIFNSTLLKLAQSDPSEPRLRLEIDQLIEGNFDKLARYRPFLIWRRFTAAADLRARTSRGVPVSLRSPAFYRLYLRFRTLLSDWSRRRKTVTADNDVFSDLLPLIGRRTKYSSCAVVGNSGILLNADHGASIDAHEAVIRLNNARITGYTSKVGSRTTLSFVNSNILHLCARRKDCFCHPYGAGVPLLLYICQPIHFLDFAACNATTAANSRAPFLVTDPRFDLLCARIVKYYSLRRWFGPGGGERNRSLEGWTKAHDGMMFHYSSGMQAVLMAAGVCERVSLYGFGKVAAAKHHYHTNQKAELQLHDYEAEYEFYRDLMHSPQMKNRLVSIFKGSEDSGEKARTDGPAFLTKIHDTTHPQNTLLGFSLFITESNSTLKKKNRKKKRKKISNSTIIKFKFPNRSCSGVSSFLTWKMYVQSAVSILAVLAGIIYNKFLKPPPPSVAGSPNGPSVTSPRIRLSDGRHLAYREAGVSKTEAKYKIIISHGFNDSKDLSLPVSQELVEQLKLYFLHFDRAGYGESDPDPNHTVMDEAFDIEQLADALELGPKFYLIGLSLGAYAVWSCLKYIPHRLSGVSLVVPLVHYWWPCFPRTLAKAALEKLPLRDQWTFWVAHYVPWLFYWWMTQKWFPSLSVMSGNMSIFCPQDLETLKRLSESPSAGQEKITQQGVHCSLHQDMLVAFSKWEFDPLDVKSPFPNNEGSVCLWQGCEDRIIPLQLARFIADKLPWIKYHEVADAGHFMIFDENVCDTVIKELLQG